MRVRADAFADGWPARDLFLSPDHAVFVDGVLIPVHHLINGARVDLESPVLAEGFGPLERHGASCWRQADTAARLALPVQVGRKGGALLELLLSDAAPQHRVGSPLAPPARAA